MQLQVDSCRQTCLIIQESTKKRSIFYHFWRFWPTPGFRAYDVTYHNIWKIFLFGWTPNSLRIPKMYNIMGIWPIYQKLLSVKAIATLRDTKWNETKRNEKRRTGKRKNRWLKSSIQWNEMKQEASRRSTKMTYWLNGETGSAIK